MAASWQYAATMVVCVPANALWLFPADIGASFGVFSFVQLVVVKVLMNCTRNGKVYRRLVSGVSIEEAIRLVRSSSFLDEDGDGHISAAELQRWMRRLGYTQMSTESTSKIDVGVLHKFSDVEMDKITSRQNYIESAPAKNAD